MSCSRSIISYRMLSDVNLCRGYAGIRVQITPLYVTATGTPELSAETNAVTVPCACSTSGRKTRIARRRRRHSFSSTHGEVLEARWKVSQRTPVRDRLATCLRAKIIDELEVPAGIIASTRIGRPVIFT